MKKSKDGSRDIRCSFCGKAPRDVRKLIAGLRVHICDECVELCNEIISEDASRREAPPLRAQNLPPKKIKEYLDQHVVGQEFAKRTLSVAVYNHYKRINADPTDGVDISKGNILMLGPTGSGKTYIAQTLARLLDVPFTMVDATCLTEAGYVGEDVENIIKYLWLAAGKDAARAARGIVCIDEIDKTARRGDLPSLTRDVGGEGVQQALLKMVESELVNVPPDGNRNRPQQDFVQVDTTHILFIACGAFEGLAEIVEQRLGQTQLGFGKAPQTRREQRVTELLRQVRSEDLIKFGLIPEFVGRFPVVVPFEPLDEDALVEILWRPRNALVKQYKKLFELEKVQLTFTEEALRAVAAEAMRRKTGARGLRSILEGVMLDVMYDLPSIPDLSEVVIGEDVVLGKGKPRLVQARKSA